MASRLTIADVARVAGVSTMTVSRVINNKGDVGKETRERVERAIAKLEYRPSEVARGLTNQRTRTLGLVVPDITNPFFPEIVRGAEDAAWERHYAVSLTNTVEDPDRERATLLHHEAHRVDGLIVCSARLPDGELIELLRRHSYSVLVNRKLHLRGSSSLEVDDAHGALLAVQHLFSSGHRRIGLLAGPVGRSVSARKRRRGYLDALASNGLRPDTSLIEECEPLEAGGHSAMHAVLKRRLDVEAIICYNDLVAVGAMEAAQELGICVPGDVAVVGCDDIRLASLMRPSLTTLRINKYELGRAAADLLFGLLEGESPSHVTMKPELVVRSSAP